MDNLEHELKHVPTGNRGKSSRLILPLAALLAYAGCEYAPKPTGFEQKPRAEYAAQGNQAVDSNAFPNPDYSGQNDSSPILPAFVDGLRVKYNTLPQAASVPFETAYQQAAQEHQRAAKAVATEGTSLELKVVQDDRAAAKPSGEQAAPYDISWMPYLKGDWSQNRKVDFDDFFKFVDKFGLKRGDRGYDSAYDLNGNGAIDFDDFFLFVDRFGMSQTGVGVRASPTIEGKLEVAVPKVPGVRYLVGGQSVSAGSGDSLVVTLDVDPKFYGQPVRLEAVGVNAQGDPVAGGLWRGDMPNYYFNGPLPDDLIVRFNMSSVPERARVYIAGQNNPDLYFQMIPTKGGVADGRLVYSNGNNVVYLNDLITNTFVPGNNTLRFRDVFDGTINRVVVTDYELKLN